MRPYVCNVGLLCAEDSWGLFAAMKRTAVNEGWCYIENGLPMDRTLGVPEFSRPGQTQFTSKIHKDQT